MRSAPCASAPSHPLHAMPPRITRNSDRPRASDRTMVNIVLLAASCTLDPCHQTAEKAYEMDNKPIVFRGIETEWAGSRERTSILRLRRSFFLDFPFYRTHPMREGVKQKHFSTLSVRPRSVLASRPLLRGE